MSHPLDGLAGPELPHDAPEFLGLETLPLDIIMLIVALLDIQDIYRVRQCSKHLAFLLSSHPVWHAALQKHISAYKPIVPLDISALELSTNDMGRAIERSALLSRAWTAVRPNRMHIAEFTPPPAPNNHERKPLRLEMLRHGGHCYALVGYYTSGRFEDAGRHVLYCLDLGESRSGPSETKFPDLLKACARMDLPQVVHVVSNEAYGEAPFAVAHVEQPDADEIVFKTYLLDFASSATSSIDDETELPIFGLHKLRSFTTKGAPLLFSGNVLVTGDKKGFLWIYDTRTGSMIYELEGGNPEANETARVMLREDILVVLGYACVRVFTFPEPLQRPADRPLEFSAPPNLDLSDTQMLKPSVTHPWRWGLEMLAAAPLVHTHASGQAHSRPQINLFVRFRSWYPWPINMLHHYVLSPGPDGMYATAPSLRLYTYSALDLFSVSDVAIGQHGTVLWTDTHNSDPRAPGGQRIAGKILRPAPGDQELEQTVESLNDVQGQPAHSELNPSIDRYDKGTTMVFDVRRSAEVCKLAMDEEAGRVVVGLTNGNVEVWDYMPDTYA
ncbi:hypothetical protein PENSPDRAFT_690220 [Peniophora sp. CONT]|nr:hypothetical protein PENSPDRAFT_690220 [Peniophora sp. CONT]